MAACVLVPRIAPVAAEDVWPLRAAVLRVGLPPETARFAQDHAPGTLHLGVYEGDRIAGCATWFPEPWPVDGRPGWRLRGMAVAPGVQGGGFGSALLSEGVAAGARRGLRLAWCQARITAAGFYAAHGWTRYGAEFRTETGIPHVLMWYETGPWHETGWGHRAEPTT